MPWLEFVILDVRVRSYISINVTIYSCGFSFKMNSLICSVSSFCASPISTTVHNPVYVLKKKHRSLYYYNLWWHKQWTTETYTRQCGLKWINTIRNYGPVAEALLHFSREKSNELTDQQDLFNHKSVYESIHRQELFAHCSWPYWCVVFTAKQSTSIIYLSLAKIIAMSIQDNQYY